MNDREERRLINVEDQNTGGRRDHTYRTFYMQESRHSARVQTDICLRLQRQILCSTAWPIIYTEVALRAVGLPLPIPIQKGLTHLFLTASSIVDGSSMPVMLQFFSFDYIKHGQRVLHESDLSCRGFCRILRPRPVPYNEQDQRKQSTGRYYRSSATQY